MIDFMLSVQCVVYFTFLLYMGGGVMDLVYGSSPSSYMDCKVIFGDECSIFAGLGFV